MKGAVPAAAWALLVILAVMISAVAAVYIMAVTKPAVPVVEYDGEFGEVGAPTGGLEDPFYSQFTIYNVEWSDDTQTSAGNATLSVENGTSIATSTIYQLDLWFEIEDGPVESITIEYDADDAGVFNTSSIKLTSVELWNYDDEKKLYEIPVEEDGDIDWTSPPLEKGEYVIRFVYKTITIISTSATEGTADTLGYLDAELDTEGDRDEFTDFLIRAVTV